MVRGVPQGRRQGRPDKPRESKEPRPPRGSLDAGSWSRSVDELDDVDPVVEATTIGVADGAYIGGRCAPRDARLEVAGDGPLVAAPALGRADHVEERPAAEAAVGMTAVIAERARASCGRAHDRHSHVLARKHGLHAWLGI